uniref:Uncharacterized protein n=1 Tax=Panagrolaimus sp. PS1159 TaxID=55785 RepID=A0AC35F693_9BILA
MKLFIAICITLLLISPIVSISWNPFSRTTTSSPYYSNSYDSNGYNNGYNSNGYNNGYGNNQNGMFYNPPTTTRASYIKNALKGAGLGALASGAYTYFKNGKK